jgi:N-methylhydantoinase B/oxoprolinase/acetone carboxylase alpha subunit
MKAGERFLLQTAAGGGYGDARERDQSAIERDIAEGYANPKGAES